MKIATKLAIAIGCAALAACGDGKDVDNVANTDANMMAVDNGAAMNVDANAMPDMNADDHANMDMGNDGDGAANNADGNANTL